ncbi:MAG: AgmX/PglI C-terminal domain-containing protein [Deltaproteobacteria bacterium]|nr:AgmX/PglI C-terminal domain-containing protein [Deltaproteobacteria bacterium]
MDARSVGLEVRWRWGDQLLWAERVPLDQLHARARLGPPGLPAVRAEHVDGSVAVHTPGGDLELVEGTPARLHFGALDAELALRPAPPRAIARWDEAFESGWWNTLLLCAVALVFAVIAAPQSSADDDSADALTRAAPRIVKLIPTTPPPVHRTAVAATHEAVAEHHSATPARAPQHKPSKSGGPDIKQLLGGSGLSALLSPSGVGNALAQAAQGLGKVAGSGGPFGGMGLRGGPGGGDPGGTTFGIGAVPGHGPGYGDRAVKLCTGADCKVHADPVITNDGPQVVGSLDRELIRQVIHRNHGSIRYCYDQALVRNPSLTGRVDMHFVIGAEGSVIQANVAASSAQDNELDACLRERFARMLFPKPLGGGVVDVRYPVVLTQGGR